MERHLDNELKALKDKILSMGGYVEKAIEGSTQALILREPNQFSKVYELEGKINQAHMAVDEACLNLLARQSPLAADLRLIVAIIKINTDLERMGDQAVNISDNGKRYLSGPAIKPLNDIPKMAVEVRRMVSLSLDAFVKQDLPLAQSVMDLDDTVDQLKDKVFRELVGYMTKDPTLIEQALNLILIARNLERLGDHATNIAEDVIFAVSGEDIRHGGFKDKK